MSYIDSFTQSDEFRREELIRQIERAVESLSLQELEALYYDMSAKNYIDDEGVLRSDIWEGGLESLLLKGKWKRKRLNRL